MEALHLIEHHFLSNWKTAEDVCSVDLLAVINATGSDTYSIWWHPLRALIWLGSRPGIHLCTLPASFVRLNLHTLPRLFSLYTACYWLIEAGMPRAFIGHQRVNRAQSKLVGVWEDDGLPASSHRFPVALTREESKRPGLERGLSDDGISQMFLQSQSKALEQKMSFFHYALSLLAGKSLWFSEQTCQCQSDKSIFSTANAFQVPG